METQKKYHDLVLLDKNNGTEQIVVKKVIFIFLLFLAGIVIGALLISFLHNKNKLTPQALSVIEPLPIGNITNSLQEVASPKLQAITTITAPSSKTDGCSVESLGRNVTEGCSVDDYAEPPVNTSLETLVAPESPINGMDTPTKSGVTNILDLQ